MLYRLSSLRVRLLMSKSIFSSRRDLQTSSFDFLCYGFFDITFFGRNGRLP